jgi:hypothetical protein
MKKTREGLRFDADMKRLQEIKKIDPAIMEKVLFAWYVFLNTNIFDLLLDHGDVKWFPHRFINRIVKILSKPKWNPEIVKERIYHILDQPSMKRAMKKKNE